MQETSTRDGRDVMNNIVDGERQKNERKDLPLWHIKYTQHTISRMWKK